ncbi:DUF6993 domain-containing protein, partial [Agromyces binzhouensis]|uniref:DUF6993 domain-containing protein n=1 Tax=Agromyces binzhouensis TaxID=1817495 RepID=UPI0030F421CD
LTAGALAIALAGCASPEFDAATATSGPASSAGTGDDSATATPAPSSGHELARFDAVNRAVIAADASAGGRAFIDALVAAGFDRTAMQVTSDTTTLGEPADSIQFSVRIGDRCLVGQYGPASDGYRSAERPGLGTGGCLIGATVPVGG